MSKDLAFVSMLRNMFDADPDTGIIRYRVRPDHMFRSSEDCQTWNDKNAGKLAFLGVTDSGHNFEILYGRNALAHRVMWAIHYGQDARGKIRHINGNRQDNRIVNLEIMGKQK